MLTPLYLCPLLRTQRFFCEGKTEKTKKAAHLAVSGLFAVNGPRIGVDFP
jgi:hypothetical protein